ncbi:MAG TPA: FAD/NAD(P)-binding oxidoreductase [Anaerolineales bacterium]|nr:FAD/NAD(P)-binding oxidoreductase [Anaerolineales bacterium]
MSGKNILILGGGVGGLVAANELRRRLPGEHRVVLVEKNPQHAFAASFLWLMTGDRRPEQITRDVRRLVRPGVEVILAEVQAIDLTNRRVQTSMQTVGYDYLIVSLGAELAPEMIPGLAEGAYTFYTFDGAVKLRDALHDFTGGKVAVVVSALPYKCPGAPHEGAMLIVNYLSRRSLGDKIEVHLFTPEPQPMPVAGPVLGEAVSQMLADKGIILHTLHKLTKVDPAACELAFDGKEGFQYDLLVAIPPHRGPRLAREAGLANEAGWIPVDRATLHTQHDSVYALGDVTAISIPGRWKLDVSLMLPKAGVFAHAQADAVARRIAAEITGAGVPGEFPGLGYCMLEAGESMAGFAFGNFFSEPSPQIELRKTGRTWHLGKVLFEQWWLAPQGLRREALRMTLTLGSKALGIPIII